MTKIEINKIVENLIKTFLNAGKISLELRKKGLTKSIKSDNTPVSNGDLEVNEIITKKIKELTPTIPIISEETSDNKSEEDLKDFWLIDPIDGTYDYINNLDEFTINAGLIINKKPAAGLIYAPAKNRMFYSYGENQAFELINGEEIIIVQIAGLIARRIVCEVEQGQDLKQGDRIGMIRFGSRVDIYFKNKKVLAKLGQNVVAGESLLASE